MKKYQFKGKLWISKGTGGWYFVTLPRGLSQEIRKYHGENEEGWGRLKVKACLNETKWDSAIWYDSKESESYLLPLKAAIRKKHKLTIGIEISLKLLI